jgi:hypothetical protein
MNLSWVDRIVNALLYEGYLLYPYRASAVKNRLRFNFGVVYPRAHAEGQSGNDAWTMQTQCLVAGSPTSALEICVRFLRAVDRVAEAQESWQEAVECRMNFPACTIGTLSARPQNHDFSLPAEEERDGQVIRRREAIQGVIEAWAEAVSERVSRISVRISNTTELAPATRERTLSSSLLSTHTILGVEDGEFVSLLEPPDELREAASECCNEGTWPVLAGEPGDKSTLLSSPIILYDYPAIAPESPGELFDSTEIDEILTLRVLTMTDDEKIEARGTDERASRILERAESLDPEQFAKLHGTFRSAGRSR